MSRKMRRSSVLILALLGLITISVLTTGQTPGASGPVMRLTATTANISGAPDMIRFDVLSWSTDADRDAMVAAWKLTARPAAAAAAGARGAEGRGGGGGGRGGAGGARGGGRGDNPDAGAAP